MRLEEMINEIKNRVLNEEKESFDNLKKVIVDTVVERAESWIRFGLKKIIIYPEIGDDPDKHNVEDLKKNVDEMSALTLTEKKLYECLVGEEGVAITSYQYDGKTYLVMDL